MNRRDLIITAAGASMALGAAAPAPSPTTAKKAAAPHPADPLSGARLMADVRTYTGFGVHRSGGAADKRTTAWLASRFQSLGYTIQAEHFDIPNADTTRASLDINGIPVDGFAQPPIHTTAKGGLWAPLARWSPKEPAELSGKIALIDLSRIGPLPGRGPFTDREAAEAARVAGAYAIVSVSNSPTGDPVAANTDPAATFPIPMLTLGRKYAAQLDSVVEDGSPVRLRIEGPGGKRQATNTIARYGKTGKWLIISTPQSGWVTCGGERGPGIALSVALAAWVRRQNLPVRLLFITTSGHEWQYAGSRVFQHLPPPAPAETALWLHLGASFGARQFTVAGTTVTPTDAPNLTRSLMVTPNLMDAARTAFAGQASIENPLAADIARSNGELTDILEASYTSAAGFWGNHLLFHTPHDDANATTPAILEALAHSCAQLITKAVT